ncbi:REP-associated tyrosine transposase [Candidatus Roseilinea sp. NK_OTU-006]|jgi:REP element-mobilizing transposase RayT|uniref:REP-associated tyrosine transposase n=1 Tax=Candidatus Roseilinea sp. NK_OTU-006 TaxID=2704250 RepID=UPI00145D76FB|nr:transposase [Candidatus Roseilinea sp. NK_OTU-006]
MTAFYRRNLPHIHPSHATFFITFRLAGSLPPEIIERLREEFQAEERRLQQTLSGAALLSERYKIQKKFFGRYDAWLDQMAHGPTWLRQPEIAQLVADEIRRLDGAHYDLWAYCIMPNHVHLLVNMARFGDVDTRGHPSALSRALHLLKGRTARYANRLLGRSGKFWQDESYDHVVRDEAELQRILQYIVNNPVKAGLVADWQSWPYTFVAVAQD